VRISSKQAIILFDIAKWACAVQGGAAGYSHETIEKLINDIINQQSSVIRDLDEEEK
jgi:hypothetical protein